ncbi:CHAD domain-containing protein [Deinococcus misasensis]|uniref:CHAD domain-containing protein n=1 Tax=Deinococcus misasensis TaxID=392413 RepID=UPI00069135CE|nr:CHAD domain-containing protein [Deinococcus misasensis]
MDHGKQLQDLWIELEAGQVEAIHEARKLTRKAQAYLRALRASRKAQKPWKKLRRTLAPVRDLDVTYDHLKRLLKELQADASTLELLKVHFQSQRTRLWSELELPSRPRDQESPSDLKELVQDTLEEDWSNLKREAKKVLKSEESATWHAWRKHLKRYRYTLEIVQEAPEELVKLLKALGNMQDMEVLKGHLDAAPEFLEPYVPELQDLMVQKHEEARKKAASVWKDWASTHQVLIES